MSHLYVQEFIDEGIVPQGKAIAGDNLPPLLDILYAHQIPRTWAMMKEIIADQQLDIPIWFQGNAASEYDNLHMPNAAGRYECGVDYNKSIVLWIMAPSPAWIPVAADHIYPYVLAHELGHIMQGKADINFKQQPMHNLFMQLCLPFPGPDAIAYFREEAMAWEIGKEMMLERGMYIDPYEWDRIAKYALGSYLNGICMLARHEEWVNNFMRSPYSERLR